jgi:hypothetical protein
MEHPDATTNKRESHRTAWAALLLVAGLTAAAGAADGFLRNRWQKPPDLLAAASRLQQVPERFGGWELESSEKLDPEVARMLQCAGYINRIYIHRGTGDRVHVALLVGPPGPISVHTPEICYSSRDYERVQDHQRLRIREDQPDEAFWAMSFRSPDLKLNELRVVYAFTTGGAWSAPDHPRFLFGGRPLLYKLQLAGYLGPGADPDNDPCRHFLKDFLPVLDATALSSPAGLALNRSSTFINTESSLDVRSSYHAAAR